MQFHDYAMLSNTKFISFMDANSNDPLLLIYPYIHISTYPHMNIVIDPLINPFSDISNHTTTYTMKTSAKGTRRDSEKI